MKKSVFITIVLLIAIILTIFYSVFIYNVSNSDFVGWLNTLISTIISVLLALMIAIGFFSYQNKLAQTDTKNKFIPIIETGLIEIWKSVLNLKNPLTVRFSDKKKLNFYLTNFSYIVIEQAIISNVFDKEQTEFLMSAKNGIDFHNNIIEQFINMNPRFDDNPDIYRKTLTFLHNNHKIARNELREIISSANEYFKFNELKKVIKKKH